MAKTYTVAQLNAYVSNLFREDFLLGGVRIRGELSNVKYHASGHIYFTLKDSEAELRGVVYRQNALSLRERLKDGMQVVCTGAVTVYERAGVYQLNTKAVEKLGQGELYELYLQRLRALEAEGLFDPAHKKPLPRFVKTLGVVTSPSGAAIHDIQTVAYQQNPYVKIVLFPALVQGQDAPASIVRGIRALDAYGVDVMIVGRGGGSMEDLWCFNDERVARAVHACKTPVISAVGHESDVTILDFVADLRAATPSAAAERGVPNLEAELALLSRARERLRYALQTKVNLLRERSRHANFLLRLNAPEELIRARKLRVQELRRQLRSELFNKKNARQAEFRLLAARLRAASPLNRLTGGYAYAAHADGSAVTGVSALETGEQLRLRFLDGEAGVTVETISRSQPETEEKHGREA